MGGVCVRQSVENGEETEALIRDAIDDASSKMADKDLTVDLVTRISFDPNVKQIEHTPTNSERDLFKYTCPVCMNHFSWALQTTCCSNFTCADCMLEYLAKRDIKAAPGTIPEQVDMPCMHCLTEGFRLVPAEPSAVRTYDSPARDVRPPLFSPVKAGESFEGLQRKMMGYNSVPEGVEKQQGSGVPGAGSGGGEKTAGSDGGGEAGPDGTGADEQSAVETAEDDEGSRSGVGETKRIPESEHVFQTPRVGDEVEEGKAAETGNDEGATAQEGDGNAPQTESAPEDGQPGPNDERTGGTAQQPDAPDAADVESAPVAS